MALRGTSGAKESEKAAVETRKPKEHIPHGILSDRWRSLAASMGFGEAQIRALVNPHSTRQAISESQTAQATPATDNAKVIDIRSVADRQHDRHGEAGRTTQGEVTDGLRRKDASARDQRDLNKESPEARRFREFVNDLAQKGQRDQTRQSRTGSQSDGQQERAAAKGEGPPVDTVAMKRLVVRASETQVPKDGISRLIDHLIDKVPHSRRDQKKFEDALGTPEQRAKRLNELLSIAASAAEDRRHFLSPGYVNRQFGKFGGQGEAFREAATEIMSLKGAAAVVQTGAGTERETFLRTLRDIYRAAGYKVVGVAPTGTAATHLEMATGIPTHSTTQFLFRTSPPVSTVLKHHAKEMLHAVLNHPTYKFERWSMDRQTVLVVADAQNLHTPDMKALQSAARAAKAKIVFVGDTRQFKAREPANPFDALAQRVGAVRLPDSPRPMEAWAQTAVEQVTRGDVSGALSQYANANRLYLANDYNQAAAKLIRQWAAVPQENRSAETLIVARTEQEAKILNRAAQYARKERGELGWLLRQRIDGQWMYRNDRVRFVRGSRSTDWIKGNSAILLGYDANRSAVDRINQAISQRVAQLVTSLPENAALSRGETWVVLDELRFLGKMPMAPQLASFGRTKGCRVIVAPQDISGVYAVYEEHPADEMLALCANVGVLHLDSPKTRDWAAKFFGDYEAWETDNGGSVTHGKTNGYGPGGPSYSTSSSMGSSWNKRIVKRESVLPSEFFNLPITNRIDGMQGFFATPRIGAWRARISPQYIDDHLPPNDRQALPFIPRSEDALAPLRWSPDEEQRYTAVVSVPGTTLFDTSDSPKPSGEKDAEPKQKARTTKKRRGSLPSW
jgi:hypothetical protein